MYTINHIISMMKYTADALPDLNGFIYSDPSDINNYRDKKYPVLLVDQNVNIDGFNLKNKHRIYSFKLFFYDLYSRKQITQRDNSSKQRDIEQIAEIYFYAFKSAFIAYGYTWKIENEENLNGFWAFYKNNDRLIQLMYNLKIRAIGSCYDGSQGSIAISSSNPVAKLYAPPPS